VPARLEFDLTTKATEITLDTPIDVALDGRFLYGAPAAGLSIEGEVNIAQAAERPGYPGYVFGLNAPDEGEQDEVGTESTPLVDLPETDADGKATFTVSLDKGPASRKPAETEVGVSLSE